MHELTSALQPYNLISILIPVLIEDPPRVLIIRDSDRILGTCAPLSNSPGELRKSAAQSVRPIVDALSPNRAVAFLAGQIRDGVNVVAMPVPHDLGLARHTERTLQCKTSSSGAWLNACFLATGAAVFFSIA